MDVEGVARGGGVAGVADLAVGIRYSLSHDQRHRFPSQRLRDHTQIGGTAQSVEKICRRPRFVGAKRHHQSDRQVAQPARQIVKRAKRRDISPVSIVDHREQRQVQGQLGGQPVDGMHGGETCDVAAVPGNV